MQPRKAAERKSEEMIWIAAMIVYTINEISSGENWYKGVIKGLCIFAAALCAATLAPAQTLFLGIVMISALAANELYRIDRRRTSAARTLEKLDDRALDRRARAARRGFVLGGKDGRGRRAA